MTRSGSYRESTTGGLITSTLMNSPDATQRDKCTDKTNAQTKRRAPEVEYATPA
jgi:hypothetical protein